MASIESLKRRVARLEGPRHDQAADRLADLREQLAGIIPQVKSAASPLAALAAYERAYALGERIDALNRGNPPPPAPTMTAAEARIAYDTWMAEIGAAQ